MMPGYTLVLAATMLEVTVKILDALSRDAMPLLQCKRMVARLQLDVGANAVVPDVHHRLEVHGLGVGGYGHAEPAEVWPVVRSLFDVQQVLEPVEIFLAERYPDPEGEDVAGSHDRNFQAAADIEGFVIDDAQI